ncbi:MAG: phosphate acyltransferase PlsX [Planctomycetota bacterium]
MRIALDGMGGDHAPGQVVAGAIEALQNGILEAGQLILVGDAEKLDVELRAHGYESALCPFDKLPEQLPEGAGRAIAVVPTSQVIGMHESAAKALRHKRDSSLSVSTRIVEDGWADAVVSAGNTGAMVASAVMNLRNLEGVHRPGIAVTVDGDQGPFTVIDVGANIAPKPIHLLHYGVMGGCLMRIHHAKEDPRVGLLNIGGEEGKGNELAREVQELFRSSGLNFVGNIEGQDVFKGSCDVIVTEGFVGNVLLKLSEGLAIHVLQIVQEEFEQAAIQQEAVRPALGRIATRMDYSAYGGALLLGVEGVVTICHGRSESRAISNAIKLSVAAIEKAVNQKLVEDLRRLEVRL